MTPQIFVLIPARGGSKGIPKKNIKPLAGYPLIAYSIAAAQLCSQVERVIVSTDSEEIAAISRTYGAEVPFTRPATLAGDRSLDREPILHALKWFKDHEGQVPDYLVYLRPTTPLRDPALINEAIVTFNSKPEAASLRSAHEASESPFKWFMRNEQGYFYGFTDHSGSSYANLSRQSVPKVYIPNGYVDIVRTSSALQDDNVFEDKIWGYTTPVCHEVDTVDDFEFLAYQIERKGSPLLDFIKTNYTRR